jgi:flagellar hook protein FlgE
MLRSLFSGVSGLRNHQVRMDVIGNNVANVNTVAFKAGRVTFKEGFAQLLQGASRPPGDQGGINPIQVGLGMQVGSIDQLYTQGNIETTGQATDLAIQGDSLFVVRKGAQSFYTRSGNFQLDADGRLVSPTNGFVVQGKVYENGLIQDGIQDIRLPFNQKVTAKATSALNLAGNLNASAPTVPAGFDINSAADRAANPGSWTESSITVYNSQGSRHEAKLQFWKGAANSWQWRLDPSSPTVESPVNVVTNAGANTFTLPAVPGGTTVTVARATTASGLVIDGKLITENNGVYTIDPSVAVGNGDAISVEYSVLPTAPGAGVNGGTLAFDTQGNIDPTRTDPLRLQFSVPGADDVDIAVDAGSGANGLSQFATVSTAVLRDQNGFTAGQLQSFSIDRYGLVTGFFTNGTTAPLAKIVLADFNNPAGLLRSGDNMYQESGNSGGAVLGFALEGSQSQMTSGALEMSNVDLAQEFTNMIIAQRGFQANSKVITTSDELLQELMQVKR